MVVEVIIFNVFYSSISFLSSLCLSHSLTTFILRRNNIDENNTTYENNNFQVNKFKINSKLKKKNSKLRFNQNIFYREIPSLRQISENNLSELWYNNDDYKRFKLELKWSKYYSI